MGLLRVRLREVAEQYGVSRYEIGRRAGVSNPTMDALWLHPTTVNPRLRTLEQVAQALTEILRERNIIREISVLDFLESIPRSEPPPEE